MRILLIFCLAFKTTKIINVELNFSKKIYRKELKLQKARFSNQLDDAHKNVQNLEAKVGAMQLKIQNLEQELSLKQWNVDSKCSTKTCMLNS